MLLARNSLMRTVGMAEGSRRLVQLPPANALGGEALSVMPLPPAQVNTTGPLAGDGNWNVYGPLPAPLTFVAARPLTSRSDASTPTTDSVKVTSTCAR